MGGSKIITLYNTLKHLKPIQLFYRGKQIFRSFFPIRPNWDNIQPVKVSALTFENTFSFNSTYISKNKNFSFLNLSHSFGDRINWNWLGYGRLWTYNLNYFEYLNQKDISKEEGIILIDDFIDQLPHCIVGLEAYPLSLRCTNWIHFLVKYKINNDLYNGILFQQLVLLTHKLEYHLLGNHLLENGFALLFGAYYFNNQKFYKQAKAILIPELKEQTLNDGGNFELSPMYHCIILLRVLDCYNFVKNNSSFNKELLPFLEKEAIIMLEWLSAITFNNGDIPLFNDAAFGVAPTPTDLFTYAKRLGLDFTKSKLSDSGYRKLESDKMECFLDVAKVGPDYQPGHAHADTFSFELHINDRPVIVHTGTSTYDVNETRFYERSTMAHNTVVIGNGNSSQVWAGHRVGKRAYVTILEDTKARIVAKHSGYQSKKRIHSRSFKIHNDTLTIQDTTNGEAIAYLHFHPDEKIELIHDEIKGMDYSISIIGASRIESFDSYYAPEFNKRIPSKGICIAFKNKLETIFK